MGHRLLERVAHSSYFSKVRHVLMIPHPSPRHICTMVHLAEQLVCTGSIEVTVLSFGDVIDSLLKDLRDLSPRVHFFRLPDGLPYTPKHGTSSADINVERLEHAAEDYIQQCLKDKEDGVPGEPSVLLSDFLHFWTIEVAAKLEVPRFVVFPVSACAIALALAFRDLRVRGYEKTSVSKPIDIVQTEKLPYLTINCNEICMKNPLLLEKIVQSVEHAAGIIINTFEELEEGAIRTIRRQIPDSYVLAIGPMQSPLQLIKRENSLDRQVHEECMQYLRNQPRRSVLYVNFGTTGMSKAHIHELACGLEASGERFLWVLRTSPSIEPAEALPKGFEDRVKNRGLVARGWAPQREILSHPSTSAFLMDCGWNSCLESISNGVPIVAWPLFADQLYNARYLADPVRVALLLPLQDKFMVHRSDTATAIRIMFSTEKGMNLKEKAVELKAASMIVSDEQGSSRKNLQQLIKLILY